MRRLAVVLAAVFGWTAAGARAQEEAGDFSPPMWEWAEERASLDYCVDRYLRGYQVEVTPAEWHRVSIRISDGGGLVLAFVGFRETVLAVDGNVLYYADFHPIATGCSIHAFDLGARRPLWSTTLQGIGPTAHSEYYNRVTLEIQDGRVVVWGWEANGRYIECLDALDGRTVWNEVLPAIPM